jgi:hypothetical protein
MLAAARGLSRLPVAPDGAGGAGWGGFSSALFFDSFR